MPTKVSRGIVLASAVGSLLAPVSTLAGPARVYDPVEPDGFSAEWWAEPAGAPGTAPAAVYEATAPDGAVPSSSGSSVLLVQASPTYEVTAPAGDVPRPGERRLPLVLSGQVSPEVKP